MDHLFGMALGLETLWHQPGGHAHFLAKIVKQLQKHQVHTFSCSSDRYHCPEFRDTLFYEIGQKMAEIRPKNVCPYMGIRSKFAHLWPIYWPNIDNFERNQLLSIVTANLYIYYNL